MAKHSHPLGLTAYEWSVLSDCINAYCHVENGHFLPAFGKFAAARRLVDKGFLTLVDQLQPGGWPVVKMTDKNIAFYNSQLAKAKEKATP